MTLSTGLKTILHRMTLKIKRNEKAKQYDLKIQPEINSSKNQTNKTKQPCGIFLNYTIQFLDHISTFSLTPALVPTKQSVKGVCRSYLMVLVGWKVGVTYYFHTDCSETCMISIKYVCSQLTSCVAQFTVCRVICSKLWVQVCVHVCDLIPFSDSLNFVQSKHLYFYVICKKVNP